MTDSSPLIAPVITSVTGPVVLSVTGALSELDPYAVLGLEPKFVSDFTNEYYRTTSGKQSSFSDAITHSRSGNAVMTDGYGPELVVNGGFDSDLSGWTLGNGGTGYGWIWQDGKAVIDNAGEYRNLEKSILEVGKSYVVTFEKTAGDVYIYYNSGLSSFQRANLVTNGRITFYLESVDAAAFVISSSSIGTTIDSVSVREMPVLKWAPHNLLTYSEELDNAAWIKQTGTTVTANQTTAPDGTLTADKIVGNGTSGLFAGANGLDGSTVTRAIWLKGVTGGETVDLQDPYIGVGTTTCNLTTEWQLFELQADNGGSTQGLFVRNIPAGGIYAWGAHLYRSDLGGMAGNPDQPPLRASYVPTTSSAVYLPRVGHHVYNGSAWVNEGLLAESEQRINLLTYSTIDSNWTVAHGSPNYNEATSPDGTQNATEYVPNTTSTISHYIYAVTSSILSTSTTYTCSAFLKANGYDYARLDVYDGTSGDQGIARFNLADGTIVYEGTGVTSTIQDFGNGWYRCSLTLTTDATLGTNYFRIFSASEEPPVAFSGDGTKSLYIYGAQIEQASTPSSLIPTSGSSVTRASESFTIPSANLPWPEPNYIGPELVTNGTFDTDVSGWSTRDTGAITYDSGALKLERTGTGTVAGIALAYQTVSGLTVGNVYEASATILFDSADGTSSSNYAELAIDQSGNNESTSSTRGVLGFDVAETISVIFVATATSQEIGLSLRGNATGFVNYDNISVREINPLSVSIAMDGRVTYADEDSLNVFMFDWRQTGTDYIQHRLDTRGSDTGQFQALQVASGTADSDSSGSTLYSPDVFVPFSVAGRHGSTFVEAAADGVAYGANTTPTALPDLSATDLDLAHDYMGTIGTFRVWDRDLGDDGIVEATNPSLEPSLSLTFEGTGTNSFVVNNWSE